MTMSKAPPSEWPLSDKYAVEVYNRTPHSALKNMTPYEKANGTGHVPDFSKLRTWYAPVYIVKVGVSVGKHENVATFGNFVGFDPDALGYLCREKRKSSISSAKRCVLYGGSRTQRTH